MKIALAFAFKRMAIMLLYAMVMPPLILAMSVFLQVYRSHVDPFKNSFYPLHLNIPDFCQGHDPSIVYDRLIKKEFTSAYHSQYVPVAENNDLGFPFCQHESQPFEYYPKAEVRVTPKLSEFMGRNCDLKSGSYRGEVTWHPLRTGYLDETSSLVSNVFRVLPSSNPQCLEGDHQ